MGNVSTRVGVSAKEREEILKQMKIRAEETKAAAKGGKAEVSSTEGRKKKPQTPSKRKTA